MVSVRARVRNGRLLVDEATDLPEGTELELVEQQGESFADWLASAPLADADELLTPEEVKELDAIHARGNYRSTEEVRARLAARKNGNAR